jgi:hypothetical protein
MRPTRFRYWDIAHQRPGPPLPLPILCVRAIFRIVADTFPAMTGVSLWRVDMDRPVQMVQDVRLEPLPERTFLQRLFGLGKQAESQVKARREAKLRELAQQRAAEMQRTEVPNFIMVSQHSDDSSFSSSFSFFSSSLLPAPFFLSSFYILFSFSLPSPLYTHILSYYHVYSLGISGALTPKSSC